jgi:hypothetical protein
VDFPVDPTTRANKHLNAAVGAVKEDIAAGDDNACRGAARLNKDRRVVQKGVLKAIDADAHHHSGKGMLKRVKHGEIQKQSAARCRRAFTLYRKVNGMSRISEDREWCFALAYAPCSF